MKKEIKASLLMIIASSFWAGAFITGKMGINKLSPVVITFLRFSLSSVILFPYMVYREKRNWKIKMCNLKYVILTGIIGMIGYHIFFFNALKYTLASKAAMINGINPILTSLLALIFLKEKIAKEKMIFVVIAFLGTLLTVTNWDYTKLINFNFNIGDVLMLCGAFLWAIYSVIVKTALKYFSPLKLTAYTFLTGAIILLPFSFSQLINIDIVEVGMMPFMAILYMAVFPSVLGYTIQQKSIKEIGVSKTSLFINLVPVFSTIFAVFFLNEQLFKLNIISSLIVIASVICFVKK